MCLTFSLDVHFLLFDVAIVHKTLFLQKMEKNWFAKDHFFCSFRANEMLWQWVFPHFKLCMCRVHIFPVHLMKCTCTSFARRWEKCGMFTLLRGKYVIGRCDVITAIHQPTASHDTTFRIDKLISKIFWLLFVLTPNSICFDYEFWMEELKQAASQRRSYAMPMPWQCHAMHRLIQLWLPWTRERN